MNTEFWVRNADLARLFEAKAICFLAMGGTSRYGDKEATTLLVASLERLGSLQRFFLLVPLLPWGHRDSEETPCRDLLVAWSNGCYVYHRRRRGDADESLDEPNGDYFRLDHPPMAYSQLLIWHGANGELTGRDESYGMTVALEEWLRSNRSGSEVTIPRLEMLQSDAPSADAHDCDAVRLCRWLAAGYVADLEERLHSTAATLSETMRQLADIQYEYERLLNVFEMHPPEELLRLRAEAEMLRSEVEQHKATMRYQIADRVFSGVAGNRVTGWLGTSAAHLLWRVLGRK